MSVNLKSKKIRRHRRVRTKVSGAKERPRISVFRSNKHIYLQLIDDDKGSTILSGSDANLKLKGKLNKTEKAKEVGVEVAKRALAKKISKAVFDKSHYKYHGRVKAAAEGLREGGLKF